MRVSTSADAVRPRPRAGTNARTRMYGQGDPKLEMSRQGWHEKLQQNNRN